MNDIVELAKFYAMSVAYGVFIFIPVANSKLTGGGFQKLISTVCAVSIFGALLTHCLINTFSFSLEVILMLASLLLIIINRQFHHNTDEKNTLIWSLYFAVSLIGISHFFIYQKFDIKNSIFLMSSAYLLGSVTYAMILGHWYLVTPKLSEKPLIIATQIMWLIILPKIIWTGYEMNQASSYLEQFTNIGGGYAFNWLMFLMRVLWGYLVIVVMSYFGWRLVKMRSIQSATGIFYSMTIFIFIGELISGYLFFKFGLYI